MAHVEERRDFVPVALSNGSTIQVEVSVSGREDVAFSRFPFKSITDTLEGVIQSLGETLERARPTKATVKMGIELAVESGMLTAAIVKGSGKGNLEITLEWSRGQQSAAG